MGDSKKEKKKEISLNEIWVWNVYGLGCILGTAWIRVKLFLSERQ